MRNPEAEKTQFLKSAFKSVTPLKSVFSFFISAIPYTLGKIAGQQWVKAILVKASIAFPKTHDIAALVGLLPDGHRLKKALRGLEKLTPYGVAYRYPAEDEWEVPTAAAIEGWKAEIETIRSTL